MNETIAAVSTAYGEGGIGIVRISGEHSSEILDMLFRPYGTGVRANDTHARNPRDVSNSGVSDIAREQASPTARAREMRYGHVVDPRSGEKIDEALVVFMPAPHSYTGEDTAEIQCHGSVVSLRKVLGAALALGAISAPPGEFTKRAFLNGRIDLAQADAVVDLIRAKTDRGLASAVDQLEGMLSSRVGEARGFLADALAETLVHLDYPDEDPDSNSFDQAQASVRANLNGARHIIEELLRTAQTGRMIREGIGVVLAGKPNAGKSSLLNALLRESRAIVSEIPGTTRDSLDEYINVRGIPVKLTDTAGIRNARDAIEEQGIARAQSALASADLVAFVVDGSAPLTEEDFRIAETIRDKTLTVLVNKSDLPQQSEFAEIERLLPGASVLCLSAKTGAGVDAFEDFLVNSVYGGDVKQSESLLVTNARHADALAKAQEAVSSAETLIMDGTALDFVELSIREAYDQLGEITGESVTDDILDRVFSRFCVGK